ncbi:MAG: efflux RND transporter permease subunit, partial [Deltaproteobacteria bacterium]|nr:efflux RND transporter permease subunit [Deltaproteobacteria bacterium]
GTLREGKIDLLIKTSAKFNSIEDILDTIITKKNQAPIYLKHLATVQSALKIKKDYSFLNGKPSVALAIYKEPSGNTLSISKQFQSIKKSLEEETHISLVSTYDQSNYIKNSISMVQSNALQGALLTILILFIFLKNFATTFIIVVSIPFAIVCSFFLLYLNGVTLNIFSLAGIALALGMVVDASVVILENIFEHLKTEERPKNAAINGTVEVAGAVIASTLTTLAVFIPILFVKGPIGIIFKDLSLSIIYGLIFSMIIAFSFIPMIAAQLLKQQTAEGIKEKIDRWREIVLQGLWILDRIYHLGTKMAQSYENILKRFTLTPKELYKKALEQTEAGEKKIEELQTTVEKQYERTLKEAIQSWKSRVSVIIVVFIIFFLSLFFIPKTEFLPEALQNHYEVTLTYPPGTSLDTTTESCKKIEAFIQSLSNISSTHLKVVAGQGTFLMQFSKPKKAQTRLAHLRAYLEKIPDTYFSITALSPLSSVTAGLETRSLDLKLKGPEMKVLQKKGKFLAEELKKVRGVRSTYLSYEESKPEIEIKVDRDKASDVGLTSKLIADNLKNQLYGVKATTLSSNEGTEWPIMVKSKTGTLDTYQKLGDLLIPSPYGIHIPLQTIAQFEERFAPAALPREEKERTLTVLATLDPKASPDTILQKLPALDLPKNMSLQMGPQIKLFQKSFWDMKVALFVAIVLIYMVMAAQFESLMHPFTILFSVPLSLIGVTASLLMMGKFLSISAFIGIIILAGIAVNNAIVLIDYINILRRRGIDREEAIMIAGKRRLRPILMTSLTTMLGMVPMALGIGSGTELYQPLAIVMVGGMISSTFLTLLFIPTIYCFFDDIGDILGIGILKLHVSLSKPKNLKNG